MELSQDQGINGVGTGYKSLVRGSQPFGGEGDHCELQGHSGDATPRGERYPVIGACRKVRDVCRRVAEALMTLLGRRQGREDPPTEALIEGRTTSSANHLLPLASTVSATLRMLSICLRLAWVEVTYTRSI
jgi:hypothetical protein